MRLVLDPQLLQGAQQLSRLARIVADTLRFSMITSWRS